MILIAEAGGTKTDWLNDESDERWTTSGINPFILDEEGILEVLNELELNGREKEIEEIHYFGSGVTTEINRSKIEKALYRRFSHQFNATVKSDMEAAVLALCADQQPAHVGILGTGSNSVWFDGNKIHQYFHALGYILGDEGSGARIGRQLINAYTYNKLGSLLSEAFDRKFNITVPEIMTKLYNNEGPQSFLASFAPFALEHMDHKVIHSIIQNCFQAFFENRIIPIPNSNDYPLHLTGSVAYHFQPIIRAVADKMGIEIGHVVKKPGELLKKAIISSKLKG